MTENEGSTNQEYIITEEQLKRLFEWPGCDEEQKIAAAIRNRKVTRMSSGKLLVDKIPARDVRKDTIYEILKFFKFACPGGATNPVCEMCGASQYCAELRGGSS